MREGPATRVDLGRDEASRTGESLVWELAQLELAVGFVLPDGRGSGKTTKEVA